MRNYNEHVELKNCDYCGHKLAGLHSMALRGFQKTVVTDDGKTITHYFHNTPTLVYECRECDCVLTVKMIDYDE
jgi:hypothetical protein